MSDYPPETSRKPTKVRVTKRTGPKEILVFGQRDPRGPDNNIHIWVDKDDKLHIRVQKTDRCYSFEQMIDERGYVEIIAK
jgi:hypothetical protein